MELKYLPSEFRNELQRIMMDSAFFYGEVKNALRKSKTLEGFVTNIECNMEAVHYKTVEIVKAFKTLMNNKIQAEAGNKKKAENNEVYQKRELVREKIKWILGDMGYSPNMSISDNTYLSSIFGKDDFAPPEFRTHLEEKFSLGKLPVADTVSWINIGDVITSVLNLNPNAYKEALKGSVTEKVCTYIRGSGVGNPESLHVKLSDDLGMDDLDTTELAWYLEKEFSLDAPDFNIENWNTVGDVVNSVLENLP